MSKSLSAGHHYVTNFKLFNVTVIKFMVREKGQHHINSGFFKNRKSAMCERFLNTEVEVGKAGNPAKPTILKSFIRLLG